MTVDADDGLRVPLRVCLQGRPLPCPWGRAVGWGAGVSSFGMGHVDACLVLREMVGLVGEVSPSGVGLERRERSSSTLCARAEIAPDGGCGDGLCGCCRGKYRRFASADRRRHYLGFALVVTAGYACLCRLRHGRNRAGSVPHPLCRDGGAAMGGFAILPSPLAEGLAALHPACVVQSGIGPVRLSGTGRQ